MNDIRNDAVRALEGRQWRVLEPLAQKLVDETPTEPELHFMLAMANFGMRRFALAEHGFRRVIALAPTHATSSLYLGESLRQQGKYEGAVVAFQRVPEQHPQRALALALHALVLSQSPVAAATARDMAICAVGLAPRDPAVLHAMAVACLRAGDTETAVKAVNEALTINPNAGDAQATAALIVFNKGDREQAEKMFRIGLGKAPWYAEGWINFAQLLFGGNRQQEAREALDRGLALKPFLAAAQYMNGLLAFQEGNYPGGVEAFRRTIQLNPEHRKAWAQLGDLLRISRQEKEAIDLLREALDKWPEDDQLWLNLGVALQQDGQDDEALTAYDQALALKPQQPAILSNQAALLISQQRLKEAEDRILKALALDPDSPMLKTNLALVNSFQGQYVEAENLLQEVLVASPGFLSAVAILIRVLRYMDRLDEALALATDACQKHPENPLLGLQRIKMLRSLGQQEDALEALEQQLPTSTDTQPLLSEKVRILSSLGRFEEAIALAERLAADNPDSRVFRRRYIVTCLEAGHFDLANRAYADACRAVRHPELDYEQWLLMLARYQRFEQAEEVWNETRRRFPKHTTFYGLWANVLYLQDNCLASVIVLREGLALDPKAFNLRRQLTGHLCFLEKFDEAYAVAREWAEIDPSPLHLSLVVDVLKRGRRFKEAIAWGRKLVASYVYRVESYLRLSNIYFIDQEQDMAKRVLREGIGRRPGDVTLHSVLMKLLRQEEAYAEAIAIARKLVKANEKIPHHRSALIEVLRDAGDLHEAEVTARQGIELFPESIIAIGHLYSFLRWQGRLEDARAVLVAGLTRCSSVKALRKMIVAHDKEAGNYDAAVTEAALLCAEDGPTSPSAFLLFEVLVKANRWPEAEDVMRQVLQRRPRHPRAYEALAELYKDMRYTRKAEEAWRKALAQDPNNARYVIGLSGALAMQGKYDEYLDLYRRAMHLLGEAQFESIPNFFFNLNCHPTMSEAEIYAEYRKWGQHVSASSIRPNYSYPNVPDPRRRLRIGYLSPDFRSHAVAKFSEPLLANHDHEVVEIFAYAQLDTGQSDKVTERFKTYADHWRDASKWGMAELAREVRRDGVDILVDLAGHTAGNRLHVMQMRPAPIQASMVWGAGQTTGLKEIDYLIGDRTAIPPEMEPYVSEKLRCTKGLGYAFMVPADTPDVTPPPVEKNGYITFGSVARPLRVNDKVIELWARVLNAVPQSKLLLDAAPYQEEDMVAHAQERFAHYGLPAERLILRNTRPYYGIFADMDIMLDTFPSGSSTTIIEGLWMGVPVVTLKSRPVMGRVPFAILHSMDRGEWAADTQEDYVAIACRLAADRKGLAMWRSRLREDLHHSPLMDHRRYAAQVEALYREMWTDWCGQHEATSLSVDGHKA